MSDPAFLVTMASVGTLAVGITATAGLRGWQEWLELRRTQITGRGKKSGPTELRELRERVRRLESIASGTNH